MGALASKGITHHRCPLSAQHRKAGKRKSIVIVAEGAHDKELKPIKGEAIKDVLVDRLGLDTRVTTLGHTQRGGKPCAYDRILVSSGRDLGSHARTNFGPDRSRSPPCKVSKPSRRCSRLLLRLLRT